MTRVGLGSEIAGNDSSNSPREDEGKNRSSGLPGRPASSVGGVVTVTRPPLRNFESRLAAKTGGGEDSPQTNKKAPRRQKKDRDVRAAE